MTHSFTGDDTPQTTYRTSQHAARGASPIDRIIGSRMRRIRKQLNLRQTDIASRIGVSFPQLQKYETGKNRISLAAFLKLCDALGLQACVVLGAIIADIERADERNLLN